MSKRHRETFIGAIAGSTGKGSWEACLPICNMEPMVAKVLENVAGTQPRQVRRPDVIHLCLSVRDWASGRLASGYLRDEPGILGFWGYRLRALNSTKGNSRQRQSLQSSYFGRVQ